MSADTAPTSAARVEPTYGGFRARRSGGLLGLGELGTYLLIASMLPVIVCVGLGLWLLAVGIVLVAGTFLAGAAVRDSHGRSTLQRLASRTGWARARSLGAHLYRSGPLSRIPWGTFAPPGLLADARLAEYRDSYGRPFALLHVPFTGDSTVVLSASPDGASLVDPEQLDAWVAEWGGWLAALGEEPDMIAAALTVEAAPDTGARLRREVQTNVDPDAHRIAQAMLAEVVQTYPAGSASIRAWAQLTVSAVERNGGRKRTPDEVARSLASRLPGMTSSLAMTGAGAARPCTAQELCEDVRAAYDPAVAAVLDTVRVQRQAGTLEEEPGLRWPDVGPSGAVEAWDHYAHDGAVSVTWTMSTPPRQLVYANVLSRLLAPHPGIDRKRVTILYGPHDPARSARLAESDRRSADFLKTASKRPSLRVEGAKAAADRAAQEEARGAAMVDFGMVVTATVATPPAPPRASEEEEWRSPEELLAQRLADARAVVANLGTTARVLLRCAYGNQAAAFTAGLPLGLSLPRYQRVPTELRESL